MKFVINKTRIKTFCIFYNLYKAFQLKINVPKFRLDVTLQDLLLFDKMALWCDPLIFRCLLFWIVFVHTFKKRKIKNSS